jgi:hypothetical protein
VKKTLKQERKKESLGHFEIMEISIIQYITASRNGIRMGFGGEGA